MNATDIVLRARSVSDLPNSKFVSHLDELNSVNEAWKDVYSALVENDDDYYVTDLTFTLTALNAVAGSNNEYLFPLPTDFLKLRYLDFRNGTADYMSVKKFNLSMKNDQVGDPQYRIKGANLWIIGGTVPTTGLTLRMGYYPVWTTITCPQNAIPYGTSYAPNLFPLVTAPAYAPYLQQMAYVYNGTGIRSESFTNATVSAPVALFTESGPVTNMVYYKGSLYWIRGGLIWYKATDLTALFIAPTQGVTPSGVTSFYIQNNTIYYTNATQVRTCDLAGNTDALVTAVAGTSVAAMNYGGTTYVFYVFGAALIAFTAPITTVIAAGVSEVQSDGTNIYYRDTSSQVHKVILTMAAALATTVSDTVVATDILDIGQPIYDSGQVPGTYIIPVITKEAQTLEGRDVSVNYDFTYPNNLVPEIMAWRSAVDYRTKQGADVTMHLMKLGHPTNGSEGPSIGLWARFEQSIRRDEYQVERIRNAYADHSWIR
jgi:hypothetical protein